MLRNQAIFIKLREAMPADVSDRQLEAVLLDWQRMREHRVGLTAWTPAEAQRQRDQLMQLPPEHRFKALQYAAERGAVVMTATNYIRHWAKLRTGKALPWVRKPTLP